MINIQKKSIMSNNKIRTLKKVLDEIKKRNLDSLLNYNSGKVVHKKQLEFHKSLKRNRWVFGGNRTGKTECGAVETVWLSLGVHPFRQNRETSECWVVSLSTRVQTEVAQAKILKYLPKSAVTGIVMSEGRKDSPDTGVIRNGTPTEGADICASAISLATASGRLAF